MACCAFIVLVLLQLLAPFGALLARIRPGRPARNAAVEWSLISPSLQRRPLPRPARRRGSGRLMAAALAIELLVAGGIGAALLASSATASPPTSAAPSPDVPRSTAADPVGYAALHQAWCGTFDAAAARSMLAFRPRQR